IGDFVLRLDSGSGANEAPQAEDESVRTLARNASAVPGQPAQVSQASAPPPLAAAAASAAAPARVGMGGGGGALAYGTEANEEESAQDRPAAKGPAPRAASGLPVVNPAPHARGQTLQIHGNARNPGAAAAQQAAAARP